MTSAPVLFATQTYTALQEGLLQAAGATRLCTGRLEIKSFPDGEQYHRIDTDIRGRNVWILGGTINDAATMELFDIAQGCVQYGAFSLTIIIPYFGYSTMERSVQPGEVVKAKNRALLFSSIPRTPQGNRIVLLDLHAEGIPYYFDSDVQPYHLHCTELIEHIARSVAGNNDFVLGATDAGRAKWVESMANDMGVSGAFLYKRRHSGTETEVLAINAPVQGKHVIVYDDMIRTGGSMAQAAIAYKNAGASKVSVITTHGLFTDHALDRLAQTGIIHSIASLDTHPDVLQLHHPLLTVHTVAPFIINKLLDDGYSN